MGSKFFAEVGPAWSVTRVKNGDVLLDYLVRTRRKRCGHGDAGRAVRARKRLQALLPAQFANAQCNM